jgi:hypothetical protein
MHRGLNESFSRGLRLAGVEVYETGAGQAHHMKHLLVDAPWPLGGSWRRIVWTGSRNGHYTSVRENDELWLQIENDALADHYAKLWDEWLTPELVEFSLPAGTSVRLDDNYDGSLQSMQCFDFDVQGGAFDEVMTAEVEIDLYHSFVGHLTTKLVAPQQSFSQPSPLLLTLMSRPGGVGTDDGADTPLGDGSNFNQGHPIVFREFGNGNGTVMNDEWIPDGSTNAEAVGSTMGGSGVICRDDQRCVYHPVPDVAGGGTLDSLYMLPSTGTWSVCFGDSIPDRPAYVSDAKLRLWRWPQRERHEALQLDSTRLLWSDQHGVEYRRFEVADGQQTLCEASCRNDVNCAAWTYAEPGSLATQAICSLKETVGISSAHSSRTSGVKYGIETSSRRWGTPYRMLALAVQATPEECAQECLLDAPTCRAWNFAPSEYAGGTGECELHSEVAPSLPHPSDTSGVVGATRPVPEPAAGVMLVAGIAFLARLATGRRNSARAH